MSNEDPAQLQAARHEISKLERQLETAKARLTGLNHKYEATNPELLIKTQSLAGASSHHYLLLLSDSALPLGSFAFSSGLESYLAHTRPSSTFSYFLTLSLSSYASTTLPFVFAAHRSPEALPELDDLFDATIMCTVGRRASVAQGRALLSIWDRSFSSTVQSTTSEELIAMLKTLSSGLRLIANPDTISSTHAHLGPLFGVVASILGLSLEQTAYVFMLSHVKALLSAAVRASMFGPYQAQKVLGSSEVQAAITKAIDDHWKLQVEDAGQNVPVMDLWIGRHEMLYSRIFNS